jgi:hypothetical protein
MFQRLDLPPTPAEIWKQENLLRWVCWKVTASISGHGMKSRRSTHTHNISSHIQEITELQYNWPFRSFNNKKYKKLESQNWIPCYKSIKTMAFR